jgi:hypothetical protein
LNDFDVMQPTGAAMNQIAYGAGAAYSNNGALLSNIVGDARVLLGGFSFIYIRDDETDGTLDRARLLRSVIVWLASTVGEPTPVGGQIAVTRLGQNHPNPFNPQTAISFSLAQRGAMTLAVYDVAGRRVRTLLDEIRAAGAHTVTWDGRNDAGQRVASGVYFCKLVTGDFAQTRKMVLLK